MPQAMWVYDRETLRFLDVNQRAIEHYGYSREEFLAMTLTDIRPEEDVEAFRRMLARGPGDPLAGDIYRHRKKSGEVIVVEVLARDFQLQGRPGRMVVASDVTAQVEAARQLRHLSDYDSVTGLFNRARFQREIEHVLKSRSGHESCAVVVFDLDQFKFINDSFGHARGDTLMREIASVWQSQLTPDMCLARLSGDEFGLLLPCADEHRAYMVAMGLLKQLKENIREGSRAITASGGIASCGAGETVSAESLMIAADISLHEAKEQGRDRCVAAASLKRSQTWVDEIRLALNEGRLALHTQPIVDLATGDVVREELLIRMLDPSGEVVPPSSFIPIAERFGLVNEIDRWVVQQALGVAGGGRCVEVNLSAHSLGDSQITKMVAQAVDLGVDPENIVFEITETAAAANYREAAQFAERLSRIGCGFALDDFGTGFGALTYLKHIPFAVLKIDMEFVRDVAFSTQNRRIVEIVVQTAAGLGQRTIAEGVEDPAVIPVLQALGVDMAQGFILGRPAPLTSNPPVIAISLPAAHT
jgi:diguanylate cyclase (GGDEF)-like protein/PAS domain S-box-containing protein